MVTPMNAIEIFRILTLQFALRYKYWKASSSNKIDYWITGKRKRRWSGILINNLQTAFIHFFPLNANLSPTVLSINNLDSKCAYNKFVFLSSLISLIFNDTTLKRNQTKFRNRLTTNTISARVWQVFRVEEIKERLHMYVFYLRTLSCIYSLF